MSTTAVKTRCEGSPTATFFVVMSGLRDEIFDGLGDFVLVSLGITSGYFGVDRRVGVLGQGHDVAGIVQFYQTDGRRTDIQAKEIRNFIA